MIVDRCIEIINSKYNTPDLNVNYIADSLGKNRSLLSHAFKSEMNVSIIDYLMAVRHFKAVDLLVSTSYPISKIATLCGFSSTNYFIRIFKKFEKMTPAVYRKS
jgi:AraC-like DNA-binding protein